jgi:hypothetical protein
MNAGKNVIIVTVPEAASDDTIEDALSAPSAHGYYLSFMLEPRGGFLRAVFKRSATYVDPTQQAAKDAEEKKALSILAANPHLSQVRVVGLLAAAGIVRSNNWVGKQRAIRDSRSSIAATIA